MFPRTQTWNRSCHLEHIIINNHHKQNFPRKNLIQQNKLLCTMFSRFCCIKLFASICMLSDVCICMCMLRTEKWRTYIGRHKMHRQYNDSNSIPGEEWIISIILELMDCKRGGGTCGRNYHEICDLFESVYIDWLLYDICCIYYDPFFLCRLSLNKYILSMNKW